MKKISMEFDVFPILFALTTFQLLSLFFILANYSLKLFDFSLQQFNILLLC